MRSPPEQDGAVKEHIAPLPRVSIQAFCETPELSAVLTEAVDDRRMARAEFCDPGTKVVVIGRLNDIVLYRDLMARGISDYLVAPLTVLEFIRAMSQLYHHPTAQPVGRILAVIGAKGGNGASTIAHNLAWSIAKALDVATVIADLDFAFGTAGLDYNQDPPQGIAEAIYAPDRLDANLVERLLSKCTDKLSLLAAPATLDRAYDFSDTAFDALVDIMRTAVPCTVLDIPHQWNAWTKRLLTGADEVVLVAAPDLANLRNAKNMLDSLRSSRPNDAKPKLVLNGVGMVKRPEIAAADFAKAVELAPLATIPFDARLFGTAANNGQMIGEVEANGRTAQLFTEIARSVTGRLEFKRERRNLLQPLLARFQTRKAS